MQAVSDDRFYAEIRESSAKLADVMTGADLTRQVLTCPDWTMKQLATHVGRAHRWAAEIAATRSAEFIPFRAVPDGKLPADPGLHATWLRDGATRLVAALREAGKDPVWTFGGMRPAGFWARRMAHETAVHRADAELTAGLDVELAPDLAADAIDEWLGFQDPGTAGGPGDAGQDTLRGEGGTLHIHATDEGLGAQGEWLIRLTPAGIAVEQGHARGDVAVRGPAARLLLVLVRRLPPDDPEVQVIGDGALLASWLART